MSAPTTDSGSPNEATTAAKAALRGRMTERRRRAAAAAPAAAETVRDRALADLDFPPDALVSAYWPLRDELDPRPLMLALAARGRRLCLPVVEASGAPLVFRAWHPGDPLAEARFGTQIPYDTAPVVVPDILLIPLLAFDGHGYRLGYGGGFYDRTLADLRRVRAVTAVGLAYAGQQVEGLPIEATDRRLDALVTERAVLRFG